MFFLHEIWGVRASLPLHKSVETKYEESKLGFHTQNGKKLGSHSHPTWPGSVLVSQHLQHPTGGDHLETAQKIIECRTKALLRRAMGLGWYLGYKPLYPSLYFMSTKFTSKLTPMAHRKPGMTCPNPEECSPGGAADVVQKSEAKEPAEVSQREVKRHHDIRERGVVSNLGLWTNIWKFVTRCRVSGSLKVMGCDFCA